MISPAEIRPILDAQPTLRLRWFAELLGWRGLRLEHVRLPAELTAQGRMPSQLVIWYMTTDEKFNLQINPHPHGQARTFRATVKAERYGIWNIGWHDFELFDGDATLRAEAERLRPWFDRRNYKNRRWRRANASILRKMMLTDQESRHESIPNSYQPISVDGQSWLQ